MNVSPSKAERTTPLREQMRRELVRLNYKASSVASYIGWCAKFAAFHGKSPDLMGAEDVRVWLSHLANDQNAQNSVANPSLLGY